MLGADQPLDGRKHASIEPASRASQQLVDDLGLPGLVGRSVRALPSEIELRRLVPSPCRRITSKQLSEAEVVRPLPTSLDHDVQMGDAMPGSSFEDEDLTTVLAGIAPMDPTAPLEAAGDLGKVEIGASAGRQVDDRLGQEPDHR